MGVVPIWEVPGLQGHWVWRSRDGKLYGQNTIQIMDVNDPS